MTDVARKIHFQSHLLVQIAITFNTFFKNAKKYALQQQQK